jgi:hypothetical protein
MGDVTRPTRSRDAAQRRRAAELGEIADRLSRRAFAVTTPVYRADIHGMPESEGTAVLIELGGVRFLVSAGHVLEALKERPLTAQAGGVLAPIAGNITYLSGWDAALGADAIDIRVVRLSGEKWDSVPLGDFLHWNELDHESVVAQRHSFTLIGYPESRQRDSVNGTTVVAQSYRVSAMESPLHVYRTIKVNPAVSLLVGFDKKRTWGIEGMVTAPDLYGASGCGLWRFGRYIRDATRPPLLSAIGVAWGQDKVKHVRGTRIAAILECIADQYPDVRAAIKPFRQARP